MKYNVIPTDHFKREAKRLIQKYPSLRTELADLAESLSSNPELGVSLGTNIYKIRLAIKSKGKGKSGGGRVITYVISKQKEVYLLLIYDKSEFDTVNTKLLKSIIDSLDLG